MPEHCYAGIPCRYGLDSYSPWSVVICSYEISYVPITYCTDPPARSSRSSETNQCYFIRCIACILLFGRHSGSRHSGTYGAHTPPPITYQCHRTYVRPLSSGCSLLYRIPTIVHRRVSFVSGARVCGGEGWSEELLAATRRCTCHSATHACSTGSLAPRARRTLKRSREHRARRFTSPVPH